MNVGFRYFTLSGKRFADGTFDHGRFTNGASTAFSFVCGVQQPTPDDLELLEEGKRTRKTLVLFTNTVLQLATKTANADNVYYEGEWYEVNVFKTFRTIWPQNYKAIMTKIENTSEVPVPA